MTFQSYQASLLAFSMHSSIIKLFYIQDIDTSLMRMQTMGQM